MLHDRAINRAPKIGMMIRNHACLVSYIIENVLEASLAEELVASAEGDLDDTPKLGEFPGGVVLNIRDAFKVHCSSVGSDRFRDQGETQGATRRTYELPDDCFPGDETLDDDVARAEVVALDVLLDERLGAGYCGPTRARGADGGGAREALWFSGLVVRHGKWSNVVLAGSEVGPEVGLC